MAYHVVCVGLVCLVREEGGGRLFMMPDGRTPEQDVDPHFPRMWVEASRITDSFGWASGVQLVGNMARFDLPKCEIEFVGANQEPPATLDIDESGLPRLHTLDSNSVIDPATAAAVVKFTVRRGRLNVFRMPGDNDDDDSVPVVSRFEIPDDAPVRIIVRPVDGTDERELELLPGTGLVVTNASDPTPVPRGDHAVIYSKLTTVPVDLSGLRNFSSAGVPRLESDHPFFRLAGGVGLGPECSNTGCCP